MNDVLRELLRRNFADVAGAVLYATIPLREALLNELLTSRSGLRIQIHRDNRLAITYQFAPEPSNADAPSPSASAGSIGQTGFGLKTYARRSANALLSKLTVDLILDRVMDVHERKVRFKVSALGALAMVFMKAFRRDIRDWVTPSGEWFSVDLERFAAVNRHRELLEHVQSVEFETAEGTLLVKFRVHVRGSGV